MVLHFTELVASDGEIFRIVDFGSQGVAEEALQDYEESLKEDDGIPPEGPM